MNGRGPRSDWTPAEVGQVRDTFGAADALEALDLFAADDWRDLYENMTACQLLRERDKLRTKAARHRAGAEMGFSPGDVALAGAKASAIRETGGVGYHSGHGSAEGGERVG